MSTTNPLLQGIARKCILTSHVCEFLAADFEVGSILGLDGILYGAWHWIVCAQHSVLTKLDLASLIALQSSLCCTTAWHLSLPPRLC